DRVGDVDLCTASYAKSLRLEIEKILDAGSLGECDAVGLWNRRIDERDLDQVYMLMDIDRYGCAGDAVCGGGDLCNPGSLRRADSATVVPSARARQASG